jgi:hypothetical protein
MNSDDYGCSGATGYGGDGLQAALAKQESIMHWHDDCLWGEPTAQDRSVRTHAPPSRTVPVVSSLHRNQKCETPCAFASCLAHRDANTTRWFCMGIASQAIYQR